MLSHSAQLSSKVNTKGIFCWKFGSCQYFHWQSEGENLNFTCWPSRPHLVKSAPLNERVWPQGQNSPPSTHINRSLLTFIWHHINSQPSTWNIKKKITCVKGRRRKFDFRIHQCLDICLTCVDYGLFLSVWLVLTMVRFSLFDRTRVVLEAEILHGSLTIFNRVFALFWVCWLRVHQQSTSVIWPSFD